MDLSLTLDYQGEVPEYGMSVKRILQHKDGSVTEDHHLLSGGQAAHLLHMSPRELGVEWMPLTLILGLEIPEVLHAQGKAQITTGVEVYSLGVPLTDARIQVFTPEGKILKEFFSGEEVTFPFSPLCYAVVSCEGHHPLTLSMRGICRDCEGRTPILQLRPLGEES